MTDQPKLEAWREILDRLKNATGPDREIDHLLGRVQHGHWLDEREYKREGDVYVLAGSTPILGPGEPSIGERRVTIDQYTANTDVAIRLIENCVSEDTEFSVYHNIGELWVALLAPEKGKIISVENDSLPLAVLTALARAEIARLEGEHG